MLRAWRLRPSTSWPLPTPLPSTLPGASITCWTRARAAGWAGVIFQCPNEKGKGILVAPPSTATSLWGRTPCRWRGRTPPPPADGLRFVRETAAKSVPSVQINQSIRNFAGVRATGDTGDFIIDWAAPGFLDLAGICSPGLSAAPAIGEYAAELLERDGLTLEKKDGFICERRRVRFKELSPDERAALVEREPAYGRVICRCETVTEGEILECLRGPIPPRSVDGVKRRVNAGMGPRQGGFAAPVWWRSSPGRGTSPWGTSCRTGPAPVAAGRE